MHHADTDRRIECDRVLDAKEKSRNFALAVKHPNLLACADRLADADGGIECDCEGNTRTDRCIERDNMLDPLLACSACHLGDDDLPHGSPYHLERLRALGFQ